MNSFKKLFGPSRDSLEELRGRIDESDVDRVSCMDITRTIQSRLVRKETRGQAMGLLDKLFRTRANMPHTYPCAKEGHIREMKWWGA